MARAWMRHLLGACLLALVLGLAACGDDDEESADTAATAPSTARTETTATEESIPETTATETEAETETEGEREKEDETSTSTSPEDQPGGAGDEEPARTLATFTGEAGRITPRVVRVPAFISVRIELRSADGRRYGLLFQNGTNRVRISVGGALGSASSTIEGLRPGDAITGKPVGAGTRVRIEATAEPGP